MGYLPGSAILRLREATGVTKNKRGEAEASPRKRAVYVTLLRS
jgi:hypothetical protein